MSSTSSLGTYGSGLNTTALITNLVSIAHQPIDDLATRQTQVNAASSTISGISSKLSTLKSAALAMSTLAGYGSFSATSSDSAVVTSAAGSAQVGNYSVNVSQLAAAQKTRGTAQTSSSTALGMSGELDIAIGSGDPKAITIASTDTLADVTNKINAAGIRVGASLLNDGTGYRLVLQGLDTGATNAFTVTQTGSVSLGFDDSKATYQKAQDAKLSIDGIDVTRPTNQVTGVIPGVTMALTKTTTSAATVNVANDPSAIEKKLQTFVAAYNDFVTSSHIASGFGSSKATNSELASDPAIRTALHKMASLVTGQVPGTSGNYRTLSSVGVKVQNDGTLTFDASKLEAAMQADPNGLRKLFVNDASISSTGAMKGIMDGVDAMISNNGAPLKSRVDSLGTLSKRLSDQQAAMETRLTKYQQQLQQQFTAMDTAVGKYQSMVSAVDAISSNSSSG